MALQGNQEKLRTWELVDVVVLQKALNTCTAELHILWDAVVVGDANFTLDQWEGILVELVVQAGLILVNPCGGEHLYAVGHFLEIGEAGFAGILVGFATDESDHLVGNAIDSGFDSGFTSHESFVVIRERAAMSGSALADAELCAAGLYAEVFFHQIAEVVTCATELGVAKGIL